MGLDTAPNSQTMATSYMSSSSTMGFPKYPELPMELRLQIIEDAIESYNPCAYRRGLTKFATVDSDWNRIVEGILFSTLKISHNDLNHFENICGKRQRLLKKITFTINILKFPGGTLASLEEFTVDCFSQLFQVMKDWSRTDRTPHSLIKLDIDIAPWMEKYSDLDPGTGLSCDFTSLPKVPVIGGLRAIRYTSSRVHLHDSALDSLHEKLPALYNAKLTLPCQALSQGTINDASSTYPYISRPQARILKIYTNNIFLDRIFNFHKVKPSLTKLNISHISSDVGHLVGQQNRITITKALAPLASLWSDSLVCLKLHYVMDVTQFLKTASESVWPHLYRLDLTGFLGEYDGGLHRAVDNEEQTSIDLLQGFISALPSMPTLARLVAKFENANTWGAAIVLNVDLSPRKNTERHDWVPPSPHRAYRACPSKDPLIPCGSLPTSVYGTIKSYHVIWPGYLVTELLDTVWQQRQLDLAVCCCQEQPGNDFFKPRVCCTQWSKETDSWVPALKNDMDILIYEMGQYWLETKYQDGEWGI